MSMLLVQVSLFLTLMMGGLRYGYDSDLTIKFSSSWTSVLIWEFFSDLVESFSPGVGFLSLEHGDCLILMRVILSCTDSRNVLPGICLFSLAFLKHRNGEEIRRCCLSWVTKFQCFVYELDFWMAKKDFCLVF